MADGGEAAGRLGGGSADSNSGDDGGGGTSGAADTQQNTTVTLDEATVAAEIAPRTPITPPPSPTSLRQMPISGNTEVHINTITTATHSQGGEGGTAEGNTTENYPVHSTYEEGDGTKEPLLSPSPDQDAPSPTRPIEQDGAGGNNNGRATVEETNELTERTCLLSPHST